MRGPRPKVVLISCAQVTDVEPVTISTSEKIARANADGLKTCVRLPSRSHWMNALPRKPTAMSRNWNPNQSSRNQRNRLVLKTMGMGPKPMANGRRRDHASRMSKA